MSSAAVRAYARVFNKRFLCEHGVASPLGAWLLVAAVACTSREAAERLSDTVGLPAEEIPRTFSRLMATLPARVSVALAAWADELRLLPSYADLRWPEATRTGQLPTQIEADAWAVEATDGLIDRFPFAVDSDALVVFANALSARLTWDLPLTEVESSRLGGEFAPRLDRALVIDDNGGFHAVVETEAAGVVAVAVPASATPVSVMSVVADPAVSPDRVHDAAHELAGRPAGLWATVDVTAAGHAWAFAERRIKERGHEPLRYAWTSVLPSWEINSSHDLARAPGIDALASLVERHVAPEDLPVAARARQAVRSAFTVEGFEAAAVSAIEWMAGGAASAPPEHRVTLREVEIRFNRPYAVLAYVNDTMPGLWTGMPLFSAWIAEPGKTTA